MPTAEEKQETISVLRSRGCSQKAVAEVTGVSRSTVKRYEPEDAETEDDAPDPRTDDLGELLPPGIPLQKVIESEYLSDVYEEESGNGVSNVLDPGEEDDYLDTLDYNELGPGQFIEEFFDVLEVGVNSKFVTLQARRAARRHEIPNRDKMASDLNQMSSGISSDAEIEYISDEYWAEAKKFRRHSDASLTGDMNGGNGRQQQPGGMVSAQSGPQPDGQWYQMPDGSQQYGRMEPGPNGQMQFIPMNPPGQTGGGGMVSAGQPGARQNESSDELQELKREIRDLKRDQVNDGGDKGVAEQIGELQETYEAIEGMMGDDGQNDEQLARLQQQLQQLSQRVAQDAQENERQGASSGDVQDRLIERALSSGDLSGEEIMDLAGRLEGPDDPEVRKKQIDAQVEREKLKNKNERTEKFADLATDALEDLGRGIGQALQETTADQSQQQGQDRATRQTRPPARGGVNFNDGTATDGSGIGAETNGSSPEQTVLTKAPEEFACPECGETTEQDPNTPGVVCAECDYTVQKCTGCGGPLEIPPRDDPDAFICPSCREPISVIGDPDEQLVCLNKTCEWMGRPDEANEELTECGSCGSPMTVTR
jgi:hypothetical protein